MLRVDQQRTPALKCLLFGLGLLAFTFLRPALFFLLPVIVTLIIIFFRVTISKNKLIILLFALIPPTIGYWVFEGKFPGNFFLSLMLTIPPVLLFIGRMGIKEVRLNYSQVDFFIKVATGILILNNLFGFWQLIQRPGDDDSFVGFYGLHGLAMHTLSLVNFIVCVFYFYKYKSFHNRKYLYYSIFFFLSAFACFFGLGLLAFCFTVFVISFDIKYIVRFINKILIILLIFFIVLGSVIAIRPQTLAYNLENISKALTTISDFSSLKVFSKEELESNYTRPRKLLLYYYYATVYFKDLKLFMLGNGPGTFNSRTSFLLNGDYSQSKVIEWVFGFGQPQLASTYVYPLWSSELLSKRYMDGTRNEPFSSVIALLAEYGFIFSALIALLFYRTFKSLMEKGRFLLKKEMEFGAKIYHYLNFIRFTTVFILVNLFLDNYIEYPELILVFVLLFKLIELYFNSMLEKIASEGIDHPQ